MFQIAFPTLIAKPDILVDLMKPKSRYKILAGFWNPDLVLYRYKPAELLLSVRATVSEANLAVQLQTSKRKGNLQQHAISSVRPRFRGSFPNWYLIRHHKHQPIPRRCKIKYNPCSQSVSQSVSGRRSYSTVRLFGLEIVVKLFIRIKRTQRTGTQCKGGLTAHTVYSRYTNFWNWSMAHFADAHRSDSKFVQ